MIHTVESLKAFELDIADEFNAGHIRAPIHLEGGNEQQLLDIFKDIKNDDWVFVTLRIARELYIQYKFNPERFDQNFDKILELIKLKEYFIRASAMDNFTLLNL